MHYEVITFGLAGQLFAIDIMTVREIRAWCPVTRLPRVPHYVVGVVNLRGAVLPVIDLAARLGWTATRSLSSNIMDSSEALSFTKSATSYRSMQAHSNSLMRMRRTTSFMSFAGLLRSVSRW